MSNKSVTKDGRTAWLRPAIEDDAAEFIRAVDSVAREMIYFIRSSFDVDVEKEQAFIAEAREQGNLLLVAFLNGTLVGWVTLLRARSEFLRHTADLGMGVVQVYRGIGLGTALMTYALQWAAEHGIEKVNLGVRASNHRARAFYHKFGFVEEGYRTRDIKDSEGHYDDNVQMACFLPEALPSCTDAKRVDGRV